MKIYLLAGLCSFFLSTLTCLALIPLLKKIKAGQNIHACVKEHAKKSGTPTMGGLAFIVAATAMTIAFGWRIQRNVAVALAVGNAYMLVGLLDDLLKHRTDSPIFTHHIAYVNKAHYLHDTPYENTEPNQLTVDYIASMTDDYFIDLHRHLFPQSPHKIEYTGYFNN